MVRHNHQRIKKYCSAAAPATTVNRDATAAPNRLVAGDLERSGTEMQLSLFMYSQTTQAARV